MNIWRYKNEKTLFYDYFSICINYYYSYWCGI